MRAAEDEVQTVLAVMHRIEQAHDAFALTWGGVPFWSAFRTVIIEELLARIADVGPKQQVKSSTFKHRVLNATKNMTLRNPWFIGGRARYLVARWERSQIVDGRETEPLSDAIGDALPGSVIYLDMTGKMREASSTTWSVEAINVAARVLRAKIALDGSMGQNLKAIEATIRHELGVGLDLKAILAPRVQDVAARAEIYQSLLKKACIEEVWSVVAYANPGLILGAKKLDIPVVDVQHGLLNFAYDGLGNRTDPCIPDKLALFGERWVRGISNPNGIRWTVTGAKHIRQRLSAVPKANRENFLLVLSQPMIREQLLSFALEVASFEGAPNIIYRLHPGDDIAACEQTLINAGRPGKVTLSVGGGPNETLILQSKSHAQLGAFSTAVLEGIALNTPTLIFPTTGFSLITPYLEEQADIVYTPENLLTRYHSIHSGHSTSATLDALFAHFDPKSLMT